jgi:hypothetical protein
MNHTTASRLMLGYCVLVTTLLAALTVSQAVSGPGKVSFDELDVHRINVREPDGTLRMAISNTDSAPGIIVKGKEYPHPSRKSAGILFFNDEGTENGGLIFGGAKSDGKVTNYGHLSFDQYEQDQVIVLEQTEDSGERDASLSFWDRPKAPLPWDLPHMTKRLRDPATIGHPRLLIGKTHDSVSTVSLEDAKGRARLVLKVAPGGAASIDFLDENGKTVRTLTP